MSFWNRRRNQLQDEIAAHIELEIEENLAAGMSAEEARAAAQKKFGNVPLAMDRSREVWGMLWLEYLWQDLRYALRTLRKSPGYTLTVVLTLALGLGATATILAVVDSVLLEPTAFSHPEQLVVMYGARHQDGGTGELSYSQIDELRREGNLLQTVAGYSTSVDVVQISGENRWSVVIETTPGFFHVFGAKAERGDLFHGRESSAPVAVITDSFWHDELYSDPHVIGSSLRVGNKLRTVVGVLPPGFTFPNGVSAPVVYVPLSFATAENSKRLFDSAGLVIARMKPGVTMAQARAQARSILAHTDQQEGLRQSDLELIDLNSFVAGNLQKPLLALLGGVAILLLIAFANVANLQIVRTMQRMAEMHVRFALGANFRRLLQQLLTESVLVSLLGATLGILLSFAATTAIRHAYRGLYTRFGQIAVHPFVPAVISTLAILAGILASLAPAFRVRRQAMAAAVAPRSTRRASVANLLVVVQIALTCVLLVTTGLFLRTFHALEKVDLGFDPEHVTTLVVMPQNQHISATAVRQLDDRLLARIHSLPGVQSAALQSSIPFSRYQVGLNGTTDVSGRTWRKGDSASYSLVSSSFTQTSRIHLVKGRGFSPQDDADPNMVALVNQTFVQKFLQGRNPLGVELHMHRDPGDKDSDIPLLSGFTIVGVVQDELQGQDLGAAFQSMVYLDYRQLPASSPLLQVFQLVSEFVIRSPLPQATLDKEVRTVLKQTTPDWAEMQLAPMEQGITASLNQRRLALRLVSSFGFMALLLSAIGIYGMLAYAVTLRRREIGIRMALGSSRVGVTQLVLGQAGRMVLFGIVPGVAGAWAAGHAVQSFLYDVKPLDPVTYASVALVLLAVALLAAAVPAHRAARVDPMEVLRVE